MSGVTRPSDDIEGCTAAHGRLARTLATLSGEDGHRLSLLPGWTVGHVLTHLARNADSHARILTAALAGEAVEQYAGGYEERERAIEAGATRGADELRADVLRTSAALEAVWEQMTPAAWRGHGLARGSRWPCRWLPFHRWREVELHHVDLGLGYGPADWPDAYVEEELARTVAGLDGGARRRLLAWLVGRAGVPQLGAWRG